MATKNDVQKSIKDNINSNGNNNITGQILQDVLLHMTEQEYIPGNNISITNEVISANGYTYDPSNNSFAEGETTTASGMYSHAEGFNSITGGEETENNLIAGTSTNPGYYSHAEGNATMAQGVCSHSEGNKTFASGFASHAEGDSTIASNQAEHSEGKYNKSNTNTISSIGIGTSENDRKNAFEVMQDGSIYIKGIGGYDGKNALSSGVKSIQTIILELLSK